MDRGQRRTVLAAALAVLVLWGTALPAAATGGTERTGPAATSGVQVDADDVVLRANVRENGDAEWAVEYRIRLDDENATEAFESLQADVEENPENFTARFERRMNGTVEAAAETTGREMAIRDVSVSTETRQLPQEYGVITYRFTWTGFAVAEGGELRVGDALAGLFLDEETTLVFAWPAGYELDSVSPEPSATGDDRAEWRGPLEFGENEPTLVVSDADGGAGETPTDGAGSGGPGSGLGLPLLAILAALLVVLGAGWRYRDRETLGALLGAVGDDGGGADPSAGGASAGGDGDGNRGDDPPRELLSNEEQVLRLLEERGGRMKQQEIVRELDWTEAKTSQVVGGLREEEKIKTFRVGRENVVTFPDEDTL